MSKILFIFQNIFTRTILYDSANLFNVKPFQFFENIITKTIFHDFANLFNLQIFSLQIF